MHKLHSNTAITRQNVNHTEQNKRVYKIKSNSHIKFKVFSSTLDEISNQKRKKISYIENYMRVMLQE